MASERQPGEWLSFEQGFAATGGGRISGIHDMKHEDEEAWKALTRRAVMVASVIP
ncbi:MAG: hypothetical protein Q7R39_19525 [Dehalococcoidia bacterium]|nr:hypothetical protein [Dehalococcoidia bacterium]